ncbi:hypothetical protein DER46DRAFT_615656 [Fusarium sp. MPI-SDFR-AT-0072]|nr:hypothetical protein DER46DRAFT_615656 [Fusarium sp. MPI-SDFR-AT-0072]
MLCEVVIAFSIVVESATSCVSVSRGWYMGRPRVLTLSSKQNFRSYLLGGLPVVAPIGHFIWVPTKLVTWTTVWSEGML